MVSSRVQFVTTMTELLERDKRTALVLADISADRFLPAARRHPGRVVNVGIREQTMIGVAAGLSLAGLRPVVHSYASFLVERPFEQIKLDLGHQDLGAVLVSIAGSYDASGEGRTHQSPADVALLDTIPGFTVHLPGHAAEVDALLRQAVAGNGRVYLRLSERSNHQPWHGAGAAGGMTVVRAGSLGTVIAVGPLLDPVLAATELWDVTVLYASTIRPFDSATLLGTLGRPDVVMAEPLLRGTSLGPLSAALAHIPHRLLPLGVADVELRRYGTPGQHAAAHGLDARGIREAVGAFLGLA
ncbi:MAG: transketolase family protein [Acidimicrobiales bacterium]|jgi:transketolase